MPAYLSLFNFTEKGIQSVKESVTRIRAAEKAAKAACLAITPLQNMSQSEAEAYRASS